MKILLFQISTFSISQLMMLYELGERVLCAYEVKCLYKWGRTILQVSRS
jgi:hypothetical protein